MKGVRDGLIVSDQDGRILNCNEAVTSLVGVREEELIGQPLTNIVLLDKVDRDQLNQAVATWAAFVYVAANSDIDFRALTAAASPPKPGP